METKYLIDGTQVEVLDECAQGWIVRRLLEYGDETIIESDSIVVPRVFDSAPTAKLDARIEQLHSQISDLQRQCNHTQTTVTQGLVEYKTVMDKLQVREKLRHLEEFLDRRITHYVHPRAFGGPRISEVTEEAAPYGGMRLLSLFGQSNGDLTWKINSYRDGSGNWEEVIPCLGYEEAKSVLTKEMERQFESGNISDDHLREAQKHGIPIPDAWREMARNDKIKSQRILVADIENRLSAERKKLDQIENGLEF